jgi:hypothetical protein
MDRAITRRDFLNGADVDMAARAVDELLQA